MRDYSDTYKGTLGAVVVTEVPLILLEISHDDLDGAVHVVNDTQDLLSNGDTYIGCPFRITLPDDIDNQLPTASLSVDNIGRDLTYWVETSGGGEGATVRIMQVMRSDPDTIEWEITMALNNVSMHPRDVQGNLGFENLFALPAVRRQYRPDTAPGVF